MTTQKRVGEPLLYTPVLAAGGWAVVIGALLFASLTQPRDLLEWAHVAGSMILPGLPAFLAAALLIGLPVWRRTSAMRTPERFYLMVGTAIAAAALVGLVIDLFSSQFPAGVLLTMLSMAWCVVAILVFYWVLNKARRLRLFALTSLAVVMALAILAFAI